MGGFRPSYVFIPLGSFFMYIFFHMYSVLRNTQIDCILIHNFSFLKLFLVFKGTINHGCNFYDVSKISYSRPS